MATGFADAFADPRLGTNEVLDRIAELLDWVSFRRFCGWGLSDRTPDETTLCRFRQEASEGGVLARAFEAVNAQLEARKLILKRGTLMDATPVSARHNPPKMKAGPGAGVAREPEANWT